MTYFNIYSDEVSKVAEQLIYKDAFLKKFKDNIDANDPFYFDDNEIVDGTTGETIRGAQLEQDTWNKITQVLTNYFHLEV